MANPVVLGQASDAGTTTTLQISVTTAMSAAVGAGIVVAAITTSGTITGVTDTKGNTYSLAQSDTNQVSTYRFECFGSNIAGALTTSDKINITYSLSNSLKAAVGVGLTQMEGNGAPDQNPAGADNAGSATPSITSGALAQPYEVCIAVESNAGTGGAITWGSGFTSLASQRAGTTGGWLGVAYKTVTSAAAVTASGTITSAKWAILFSSYRQSPIITTGSLPSGNIGTAYSASVAATGGTGSYTFSLISGSLPAGLSLSSAGVISGTPTTAGTSPFTVRVTDTNSVQNSQAFSITVAPRGVPNLVATYKAAAGATLTPQIPVASNVYDQDTILVSCLATAGAVSGVTDSAGNTYSLVQSETANASCQIYTFAAYGASAFTQTPPSGAAPVGAITHGSQYPGLTTSAVGAADIFDGLVGEPNMAISAQKIFFQPSPSNNQYPTSVSSDIQGLLNVKCQLILCFAPDSPGTTAQANLLSACITMFNKAASAAGAPKPKVVLWQEGNNGRVLSSAQFVAMFQYYYPTVSALGNKVIYCTTAGPGAASVTAYYPGDAFCDELSIDYYCTANVSDGNTFAAPLAAQSLADNALSPKPFGFLEIGLVGGSSPTPTQSEFQGYMGGITSMMSSRIQQGKQNGVVLWFNGHLGVDANTISSASDYRIPYIQTLYSTIAPVATNWIQPVYTSSSSAQAVIVASDDGVQPLSDVKTGATASSGTTMSANTGALAYGNEHLLVFFANLNAGGAPVLGDSLTQLAQVQQGPYLTAAYKNITAPDTPSATITSTVWSVSVITDPLLALTLSTSLATGIVGESYSQTATATGGTAPYTWSLVSGTLPAGLSLSSAGVISGSPTTAGTSSFTIKATDATSNTGSFAVSIQIFPVAASGVPATTLPTNLLAVTDSDFEATGFTWAAGGNAQAPFRSSAAALSGASSLAWAATSTGDTWIATNAYPVIGGKPYIASGFMRPAAARNLMIGVEFFDGTSASLGVQWANSIGPATAGQWTPSAVAVTAPSNAVTARVEAKVLGANAGEVSHLDLTFLTQSDTQVLIDWVNPTFAPGSAAGNAFMDVSPWVRMDTNGVTYTRGRQDAVSEIQPGSGSFALQNDQGTFTRFSTSAIPSAIGGTVSLHKRTQLNMADETGAWWTRFDGTISEIDYSFDVTGNTSQASIVLTDVLAFLNREDSLACWTKEQILVDDPLLHWTLNDSGTVGGAGVAAETSGNNGPPMRLVNSDSTNKATIAWGDTTGGVETLADAVAATGSDGSSYWAPGSNQPSNSLRGLASGVVGPFTTPLSSISLTPAAMTTTPWATSTQTAQNTFIGNTGYMLEAELSSPIAPTAKGSDYSIECWFTMDPSIATHLSTNYGPFIALGLGSSRTYTNLLAGLFLNAGALSFECATYNQPPAFKGLNWSGVPAPTATASTSTAMTADKARLPHHLLITIQGDPNAATVTLWLDGNNVGNFALPTGQTYDTITVGGAYGGCGAFFGNLSAVSVYPYIFPARQVTLHAQLGQYGMWENTSDDCVAQIASYAMIPSYWNNVNAGHIGLAMTEYFDINNSNAMSAMQQYEQTEQGLLYVNSNGALNFHTRDWRMGYGPPDVLLPPNTFDANLQYELVDNIMCNEMGVTGPNTLGATAVTTLQNTSTGATSTQTNTSTLVQASFVNKASQNQYGVYSPYPVNSPVSLPLITWSRGYASLGLPSFSYWAEPSLTDFAAWNANSRSDPALLPATLTIDLLTLDSNTGLTISALYGLDIDNLVAPSGTLPASLPNGQGSTEWFIEGIQETRSQSVRSLVLYTSPAANQRAWIPGDSVYGVLGSTTRIGISAADLSATQADGKDVSHDAGPPYWPPTFSGNMNSQISHGFVGANDMRGLAGNLQLMLAPPVCVVSASSETQSVNNGALTAPQLFWDVVHVDTASGMGLIPGWPNWYVVTTPGFYEIDANVTWSLTGSGLGGYTGQAWIIVAQQAAQALASGVGTPLTVNQYVCPIGESPRFNSSSMTPVCAPTVRMYLGLGDMVCIGAEQNYTSSRGTSTAGSGSSMSIRFVGLGRMDDRCEINSSIANGGTVTIGSHGPLQQAVFVNTHTYSYQGDKGFNPNGRRNTDGNCYQGTKGSTDSLGSQASQIAFNLSSIQSTLTGHTVLSAQLTCSNLSTWYSTGGKLMVGYTKSAPGATSYDPSSNSTPDIMHQSFTQGQSLTFTIPVQIVTALVSGGGQAIILGDGDTTDLNYYGYWAGGPGSWTLTVNYV